MKKVKSLNEHYPNICFLTNALGEETGHEFIPTDVEIWFDSIVNRSSTLLYLVNTPDGYGILGINEFDDYSACEMFNGNRNEMNQFIHDKAEAFTHDPRINQYDMYVGDSSGFNECDEIAIFFPMEQCNNEMIQDALQYLDECVYQK